LNQGLRDKKYMEITLFNSTEFNSSVRCVIHVNGRLTFSWAAIDKFNLYNKWCIELGKNENDPKDRNLYMYIHEKYKENSFRINTSYPYCYLNTGKLFDQLNYDYKNMYIYFNIVEDPSSDGQKLFKLIYREKERTRFSSI
jgi:hypothetical protein